MTSSPPSLDRHLPGPDVRERFAVEIRAPASVVMATARDFDLESLFLVRMIFRAREKLLGASPPRERKARGLLEEMLELGWGVLEERPDRLIVCGAVCQPWLADVVFQSLPPQEFASYGEPDRVKIVWSLEAERLDAATTRFGHETRALATDREAREKFRRYWRWARYGIVSIRLLLLPAIRRQAERRVR